MKKIVMKEFNKIFFKKKVLDNNKYYYLANKNFINCFKIVRSNSKIINYCSTFIFIVIYLLYYLSLEKCVDGHRRCSKRTKWIRKKLNEGLICSVLLLIMFELMIKKCISKMHLIHVIIIFISFYIYSHDLEFDDHGLFNILGISLIIIIGIIFLLPINLLFYLIKKNYKVYKQFNKKNRISNYKWRFNVERKI